MNLSIKFIVISIITLSCVFNVYATRYELNDAGDTVLGEITTVKADERDTLLDIARRHGFGYQDMKLVNPDIDTWKPGEGQEIVLPAKFILPVAPKKGIVLNVPEMRLYYYLPKEKGKPQEILTYPLGVGRSGWNTPYINTTIIQKKKNPNWYPPESIRKEHEEKGDPLPKIVESGPDNPLGYYAMRLGQPDYLIHGTNKPYGVGMRVSHGCIRLYPEDIETLFSEVSLKTSVNIINQPYKIGVKDNVIYLEAHPFLDEDIEQFENNLTSVVALIVEVSKEKKYELDWAAAYDAINNPNGLPIAIGMFLPDTIEAELTEKSNETLQANAADKMLDDGVQEKVSKKLNSELTQAEKVSLELELDSELKD